jgi:hypothetical protein
VDAIPALLDAVEDRNVSIQKSAVRALLGIVERAGLSALAERIAALEPEPRRRAVARITHQAPHDADALRTALAGLPDGAFVAGGPAAGDPARGDAETRTLVRFREWLAEASARGTPAGSRP